MKAEALAVRCLRVLGALMALACMGVALRYMLAITCDVKGYSAGVLASVLLIVLMLFIYTHLDLTRHGAFQVGVRSVRAAFAAIIAIQAALAVVIVSGSPCGEVLARLLPVPAALMVFYTCVVFVFLFGDAYLGLVRDFIRLGRRPEKM